MLSFEKNKIEHSQDRDNTIEMIEQPSDRNENDIAIIGMSGMFPLASSIDQFWENLKNGIDCVQIFPEKRKRDIDDYLGFIKGLAQNDNDYANYAFLEEIDHFDYSFFNISRKEASLMDPSQRLFLQVVWQTLEEAGYGGEKLFGTNTGVFCGDTDLAEYKYRQMVIDVEPATIIQASVGNLTSVLSSRLSYFMDWQGPSMVIDTSGSSSLVALHKACQSIRAEECDQAIVGTSRLDIFPLKSKYSLGFESSDGRTRTFDEHSNGTGFGEGVMAILIKPLNKALLDGDQIHAVVKGSAINQDGRFNGITESDRSPYEDLLVQAWRNANVQPSTISFIEAHGIATSLGDSIEIDGLQKAFSQSTDLKQFCAIGSVKSNIGHLHHAAGLAGLIKSVLALKNRELPPTLHVKIPNQKITISESSVYVANELIKFSDYDGVLRCGVSSFGMSGTNCHVVLEEAPLVISRQMNDKEFMIFTLSAKSKLVLHELVSKYVDLMSKQNDFSLNDLCYTANTGRSHFNYRLAMVLHSKRDFKDKLIKLQQTDLLTINMEDFYYNELKEHNLGELTDKYSKWKSDPIQKNMENKDFCFDLCMAYIQGAPIDWNSLYENKDNKRISLPVYPFEKHRCWIDIPGKFGRSTVIGEYKLEDRYNNIEHEIMEIFRKYLGFHKINVSDSFYELGGDSITAVKIVNDINKLLNINARDVDLFNNPSVMQFSKFLEQQSDEVTRNTANLINRQKSMPFYPLSSAQGRIFVMTQYDPQLTMYNKPFAVIIEGEIDHDRLQFALSKLIQRHDSLRTSFDFVNSEPVQIVNENINMMFEVHSLVIKEEQLNDVLKKFTKPFDLRQAPLARGALVKLTNNRIALLFDIHHIISDGTSLIIFLKELMHYYDTDDELEPLPIQYKDYAIWQNELRHTNKQDKLKQFWVSKFSDQLPQLHLPTDFRRPSIKTFEGDQIILKLDKDSTSRVYSFAKETGSTIYVILLAAYHLLLMKQTDQEDIILGTVVQGRSEKDLSNIIGMFVNTTLMRNRSNKNYTFHEFVSQVQRNYLQILEHQDYPFEDLVTSLNIKRDRSRNPLFDAAFILHNMFKTSMKAGSFNVHNHPFHNGISIVDIALEVYESKEELICHWEYNTSLFKRNTIEALGEDFFDILIKLLNNPDLPLSEQDNIYKRENLVEDVEFLF